MFNFRKGSKVPLPEKIKHEYEKTDFGFIANVSAEKIEMMLTRFIAIHDEPLFFIFEIPARKTDETEIRPGVVESLHKEVYYIDGCSQNEALSLLDTVSELLINDGLCSFGFGCHESNDEIMVGKYNCVHIYTANKQLYEGFFEHYNIKAVDKLITAWDTFTRDNPGESERVDTNGKSIYDVPEMLKEFGMYLAEVRED